MVNLGESVGYTVWRSIPDAYNNFGPFVRALIETKALSGTLSLIIDYLIKFHDIKI